MILPDSQNLQNSNELWLAKTPISVCSLEHTFVDLSDL